MNSATGKVTTGIELSPSAPDSGRPVLLRVDSSPREGSATRSLSASFVDAWLELHPDGDVCRHDLPTLNLPHLTATEMGAWFAQPEEHTALHELVLARSNWLIDDLLAADELVIGAPMWNFSVPSSLKAWIDHVTRAGRTIAFGAEGPYGIVPARRAVVVTSRGSQYEPGSPTAHLDMQAPYLRLILGFLGVDEVAVVNAEGQGPNYPNAAHVLEVARAEVVALAASSLVEDVPG